MTGGQSPRWPYVIIGILLLVPVLLVGGVALALWPKEPQIASGSILELDLGGGLPEYVPTGSLVEQVIDGEPALTFSDQLNNLKKAARDDRIKGVVVYLDGHPGGWGKSEELRDALNTFRASKKFAIGYTQAISENGYYVALALDELYLTPGSYFEMNGFASEYSHLPGLLARLGIGVQYFAYGKYKSASGQSAGLKAFTPPVREMINSNLDSVFNRFVKAVAEARGLTTSEVIKLINTAVPSAEWALAQKLITGIAYKDEFETKLKAKLGLSADRALAKVTSSDYRRIPLERLGLNQGSDQIGILYAEGLIETGAGGRPDPLSRQRTQGAEPLISALRSALENDQIKAVVFRINSPGGSGIGPDLVRREVERLKAKKPVVVSMSDVAASGGYWIAMDATHLVAEPLTTTGSVGVYSVIPNIAALNRTLETTPETFQRGSRANWLSLNQPLNPELTQLYAQELRTFYNRFVALAAKARGKSFTAMEAVAQGRSWTGEKAKTLGLIDTLGGLDTALDTARELAKIPKDRGITVVNLQPGPSLWITLLQNWNSLSRPAAEPLAQQLIQAGLPENLVHTLGYLLLMREERFFTLAEPEYIH